MADIRVQNHGSLFLLVPDTDVAQTWLWAEARAVLKEIEPTEGAEP
jgi:hypothetical protein